MRKSFILAMAAMMAMTGTVLFTSCSDDDTNTYTYIFGNGSTGEDPNASKVLTLNITADGANTEVVKTDLTTGADAKKAPRRVSAVTTDPGTAQENIINNVTVGVFGSDGAVKVIKEIRTGLGATTANVTIKSNRLTTSDQVLVAANIPSGMFAGCLTAADFQSRSLDADKALAWKDNAVAASEQANNLPMFASANGLVASGDNYSVSATLVHAVAKVSLLSVESAFDVNGAYNQASFTPQQVFLWNVPSSLKIGGANISGVDFFHGWNGKTSLFKDYLGTGAIAASTIGFNGTTTTSAWGKKYFFYTMPNADTKNDTRLVIAGLFKKNQADKGTIEYYPVHICKDKELKTLRNINYQVSVTIKGEGSTDPGTLVDPANLTVNLTVKSFAGQTISAEYE